MGIRLATYLDYRFYLQDLLEQRKALNGQYSLRAFSRRLGINTPRLSEILNRKRGMSLKTATKISTALQHSDTEADYFCNLVQLNEAKTEQERKIACLRIAKFEEGPFYEVIKKESFDVIAQWQHFAIVELTDLKSFKNDPKWIANKLDITESEAALSLQRLLDVGLLRKEAGKIKRTHPFYRTEQDVPSSAIRQFHKQMLDFARKAISTNEVKEREFSSNFFLVDATKLSEIKKRIQNFRRELSKFATEGTPNEIYALNIQFFRLGNKSRKKNNNE